MGELISAIGGHPYLVRLAMYEISCGNITLNQLLDLTK
nr:AAA-like domain-containing protein [Tychonema sp. BBK16]